MKISQNINNGPRNKWLDSGGFWRDVDLSPSKIKGQGACVFFKVKHGRNKTVVGLSRAESNRHLGLVHATRRADVQTHGASVCWSAWAAGRWRTWQQACDNALRGWTCCQNVFHPPRVLQWSSTASCWLWRHDNCLEILAQLGLASLIWSARRWNDGCPKEAKCVTLANSHLFLSFSENDGLIWLTEVCSWERNWPSFSIIPLVLSTVTCWRKLSAQ